MADAMYAAERQARKETEERNQIAHAIAVAQALKKEQKIKQAATLARAEKDGLMASTFSKFNQEVSHERNKEGRLAERCDDEDDKQTLAGMGKRRDE